MRPINFLGAPVKIIMDEPFDDILRSINEEYLSDRPLFVLDIGDIVAKIKTWRLMMPRVKIFYAVKCNDHPYVLKLLKALGTGFDCASKNEIKLVRDLGVAQNRIIYAHPSKPMSHIKAAASYGVDLMTFDSKSELHKMKLVCPQARCVLRIRCDAKIAQCPLGMKFGVLPDQAYALVIEAQELGMNLVGVSFHVGSGCQEPAVFERAIREAREVFNLAKEHGFNMTLLDIGGGFPGTKGNTLDELANYINKALDEHFPNVDEIEVMAEPGRYVVASAFTLITTVLSTQCANVAEDCEPFGYYMNDGKYGSFNCMLYDHQTVEPHVMKKLSCGEPLYESIIWGPTCDSFDLIMDNARLPKLIPGDSIFWKDMGAYTLAAATKFNGFPIADVKMIVPYHIWRYLDQLQEDSVDNNDMLKSYTSPIIENNYKPFFSAQVFTETISTTHLQEIPVTGTDQS